MQVCVISGIKSCLQIKETLFFFPSKEGIDTNTNGTLYPAFKKKVESQGDNCFQLKTILMAKWNISGGVFWPPQREAEIV